MLTRHDDMLCHQVARPFESVSQTDINWTERVHFPCMSIDGKYIIDVGFGYYPNRDVMDAFGGVAAGSKVYYMRGARQLRPRADEVGVGPLRWEVIEGLKKIRCVMDRNDAGFAWDLVFEASFPPSNEEYHTTWRDGRLQEDQVRFYQMGRLSGWLEIDGGRIEVTPEMWRANRDRSWGVRGSMTGPAPGQKPATARGGGLYNFAYIQFEDWAIQHFRSEDSDGAPTYHFATRYFPDRVEDVPAMEQTAELYPGQLHPKSGTYTYHTADGSKLDMTFEHMGTSFPTLVGGYGNYNGFIQGQWMGEEWVDTGRVDLSDPEGRSKMVGLFDHACRVQCGDEVGYAIVECMPRPPYRPYGL